MRPISRRFLAQLLVGSGLVAAQLLGPWRRAQGHGARWQGDDDLVVVDGWILKRSEAPDLAHPGAAPIDL
jgi:hypothetical protein